MANALIGLALIGTAQAQAANPPSSDPPPNLQPIPDDSLWAQTRLEAKEPAHLGDLIGQMLSVWAEAIDDRLEVLDGIWGFVYEVISRDTGSVREPVERAAILVQRGNFKEALKSLDLAIKQQPNRGIAYAYRGYCRGMLARSGDRAALEAALADVRRALQWDPDQPRARLARGLIGARKGDYDAAVADLSWVIEHQSEHTEALILRGHAWMTKGEIDRALADFERAASGHLGWLEPSLLLHRGKCYARKGDFDRAITDLTGAIEGVPDDIEIYQYRAYAYRQKDDLDRAREDYDEIVHLRPKDPMGYIERANLLLEMGDDQHAMVDINRVVQLRPKSAVAYCLRAGIILLARRDWDRALADMDRAITLDPQACPYYALRSFLHARKRRLLPTCRDLALALLTFDQTEFQLIWGLTWNKDTHHGRFWIGLTWRPKRDPGKSNPDQHASELDHKCFEMGVEHLLAAAFSSSR